MTRFCFALDLKDDPQLIAGYERHHQQVWPAVLNSIRDAGIDQLQIFRAGNRLFMIMEVTAAFSFEAKAAADAANEEVQAWEKLMWDYQQAIPVAAPGEKWVMMNKIFDLATVTGMSN